MKIMLIRRGELGVYMIFNFNLDLLKENRVGCRKIWFSIEFGVKKENWWFTVRY